MSIASEISRINTNIAAAYSACRNKGAVMPQTQNSANLAAAIGGIGTKERDMINFYLEDGTLIESMDAATANALTDLPPLPERAGLTAQGWTHTLAAVKSAAQAGKTLDVGATYTTSDGSTKLYFYVSAGTRIPALQIWVRMRANRSATVDWGDGTTGTLANTSSSAAAVYAEKTNYPIAAKDTIICVKISGGSFSVGKGTSNYTIFGNNQSIAAETVNAPVLIRAELGANCTGIETYAFTNSARCLESVVIPQSVTSIGVQSFMGVRNMKVLIIPASVSEIPVNFMYNCTTAERVILHEGITSVARQSFLGCTDMKSVSLPDSITSIGEGAFRNCDALQTIVIPANVASIDVNAFDGCYRLCVFDLTAFSDPSSIPSLADVNVFDNTPAYLKFVVADQTMKTAFTTAANWSAYASKFETAGD